MRKCCSESLSRLFFWFFWLTLFHVMAGCWEVALCRYSCQLRNLLLINSTMIFRSLNFICYWASLLLCTFFVMAVTSTLQISINPLFGFPIDLLPGKSNLSIRLHVQNRLSLASLVFPALLPCCAHLLLFLILFILASLKRSSHHRFPQLSTSPLSSFLHGYLTSSQINQLISLSIFICKALNHNYCCL